MPHPTTTRRAARLLVPAGLCTLLAGCNMFMVAAYLISGPPGVEPDFEVVTRGSLTEKDTVVAVVCYAPTDVKADIGNEKIDQEIARYVAQKLTVNKIAVRSPDEVWAWLDRNPDWDEIEEIGEAMAVDHVIYIDLTRFSLWEENSHNLYRGRAEAVVSVVEMSPDGGGEEVYGQEIVSRYPLAVPRSSTSQSYPNFKQEYLLRLSEEIGRLFYPHYNGDDFQDAA